jgi:hypothetical protein
MGVCVYGVKCGVRINGSLGSSAYGCVGVRRDEPLGRELPQLQVRLTSLVLSKMVWGP